MHPKITRHRDEAGGITLEMLVIQLATFLLAGVVLILIHQWISGEPVTARMGDVAVFVGGTIALLAILWGGAAVGAAITERANRRTRHSIGPRLAEWLGHAENDLTREDLRAWRKAERSGLTVAEAQRWSDYGIPYVAAAIARRRGVSLGQVKAIGQAMRDGGLWDGTDREVFDDCVARHTAHLADSSPGTVIHRWVRFTPDQIAEAFTARLRLSDVRAAAERDMRRLGRADVPIWRKTGYAVDVLQALETPHKWSDIQQAAESRAQTYNTW
jgi:xanthosine utilization system XapX-like protein